MSGTSKSWENWTNQTFWMNPVGCSNQKNVGCLNLLKSQVLFKRLYAADRSQPLFRIGLESLEIPTPIPAIHHPTSSPSSCCFILLKLQMLALALTHVHPKYRSSMNVLRFRCTLKSPNSSSDIKSPSVLMHFLSHLWWCHHILPTASWHPSVAMLQRCPFRPQMRRCLPNSMDWLKGKSSPWVGVLYISGKNNSGRNHQATTLLSHKSGAARHSIMFNSPEWFLSGARFTIVPCNDQSYALEGSWRPILWDYFHGSRTIVRYCEAEGKSSWQHGAAKSIRHCRGLDNLPSENLQSFRERLSPDRGLRSDSFQSWRITFTKCTATW